MLPTLRNISPLTRHEGEGLPGERDVTATVDAVLAGASVSQTFEVRIPTSKELLEQLRVVRSVTSEGDASSVALDIAIGAMSWSASTMSNPTQILADAKAALTSSPAVNREMRQSFIEAIELEAVGAATLPEQASDDTLDLALKPYIARLQALFQSSFPWRAAPPAHKLRAALKACIAAEDPTADTRDQTRKWLALSELFTLSGILASAKGLRAEAVAWRNTRPQFRQWVSPGKSRPPPTEKRQAKAPPAGGRRAT